MAVISNMSSFATPYCFLVPSRNCPIPAADSLDAASGLNPDSASITRYGEKEKTELFMFDFIRLPAMAQDVAGFYLARYRDRKKVVSLEVFLDNTQMEFADAVTISPMSDLLCEVQKVNVHPGSARAMRNDVIAIIAREY